MSVFYLAATDLPAGVIGGTTTRQYLQQCVGREDYNANTRFDLFQELANHLDLPDKPCWLNQTHSNHVAINPTPCAPYSLADAAVTDQADHLLVVLTADCLPILLACKNTKTVAVIHAGWRGLLTNIISNTLASMPHHPPSTQVWFGPAICRHCYIVSDDVYHAFIASHPRYQRCFKPIIDKHGHYYADLKQIAILQMHAMNIDKITDCQHCTAEQRHTLYSYRRQANTGRMASFIYFSGEVQ